MIKPTALLLVGITLMGASCEQNQSQNSTPTNTPTVATPLPTPAIAQRQPKFYCGVDRQGIPTTYGITDGGTIVPVIRWMSEYFKNSGYTPAVRCNDVSERFEQAHQQKILNFVTTGIENNLPVICVSSFNGGRCQLTLFTLKPEDNASQVINDLFSIDAQGPITQRPNNAPYVNFQEFLNSRKPD